uniref:Uncharacterized protein n=1 Tax=Arundo donax TaxID=35708 RepID=A0A0A8ZHF4_ARUDO
MGLLISHTSYPFLTSYFPQSKRHLIGYHCFRLFLLTVGPPK